MRKAHAQHNRLHPKRLGYFRKETTKLLTFFSFLCINRRPGSSRHSQSQVFLVANHSLLRYNTLSSPYPRRGSIVGFSITKQVNMTSLYCCVICKNCGRRYFIFALKKKHCRCGIVKASRSSQPSPYFVSFYGLETLTSGQLRDWAFYPDDNSSGGCLFTE